MRGFKEKMAASIQILNGRVISEEQAISDARFSAHGNMLLFYEMHQRMGCFPWKFFEGKDPAELTYEMLEQHYNDREL